MTAIEIGQTVPDFELPATGDKGIRLSDFRGRKHVVLYFYPKDDTPGCTTEGRDFNELHARLARKDAVVLGISRDSIASHERFKAKYGFAFDLLSDVDESVCTLFDVIKLKNMYGKQVRGIERSTFLIDRDGVLRREWRKVKVAGHAEEVLDALKTL
ncbi:MAG: peroxiredoxin [Ectothiorhodospiraceae bacterium]|nr:peroxiredoxin [Ectothiorhodospiraceae bacterium]